MKPETQWACYLSCCLELIRVMQPIALSPEPLIIFAGLLFFAIILPVANWIALRGGVRLRLVATNASLITLLFAAFLLGKTAGLSMAWYHWKSEYKEPLQEWQARTDELLNAGKTNEIVAIARRFRDEKIQPYGREKLFGQSRFHSFVDEVTDTKRP